MKQDQIITDELLQGDLFKVLGLVNLSEEQRAVTLQSMIETVYARALTIAGNLLSDTDKQELVEQPADDISAYLETKGIDLTTLLIEESVRFRLEVIIAYKEATTPNISEV